MDRWFDGPKPWNFRGYLLFFGNTIPTREDSKNQQHEKCGRTEPKALACYGLLVRWKNEWTQRKEKIWLRFVKGNPCSDLTIQYLQWICSKAQRCRKRVLVLFWDHASWHVSKTVTEWLRQHNRQVKQSGKGVRLLICLLPKQSPWLNAIEPLWIHGKRKIVEPDRKLAASEVISRVCAVFGHPVLPALTKS